MNDLSWFPTSYVHFDSTYQAAYHCPMVETIFQYNHLPQAAALDFPTKVEEYDSSAECTIFAKREVLPNLGSKLPQPYRFKIEITRNISSRVHPP